MKLEKALGSISVVEKADIITEIRSHVMEAQQSDPGTTLESTLSSLGEPEIVANRYLLERGLKPQKPPRHPTIKWLTIGFLGTLSLIGLFILILIWKLTPVMKVDEKTGHVQILGGLIDVTESSHDGESQIRDSKGLSLIKGSTSLNPKEISKIRVLVGDGKFEVGTARDKKIHWTCWGATSQAAWEKSKGEMTFDARRASARKCEFTFPAGVPLLVEGRSGIIDIVKPQFDISVKADHGKVEFTPKEDANYRYDVSVENGVVDKFTSSNSKDAYQVVIRMKNGMVEKH